MSQKPSIQITPSTLTVAFPNGEYITVSKDDSRYKKLLKGIKEGNLSYDDFANIKNPEVIINKWMGGKLVKNHEGKISVDLGDGDLRPISIRLAGVLEEFIREGYPADSFAKFAIRLERNRSMRSRDTFYGFIVRYGITITPEGKVRGYKAIKNDWTDKHTGKIDNSIGVTVPRLDRRDVDDDPNKACSFGYHFGSIEYVRRFSSGYGSPGGDRIVVVEVDPEDIVCVPSDCSQQKVRCTQYTVVGEFTGILPAYSGGTKYTDEGSEDDDYDVDDYEWGEFPCDNGDSGFYCPACLTGIGDCYSFCPHCGEEL